MLSLSKLVTVVKAATCFIFFTWYVYVYNLSFWVNALCNISLHFSLFQPNYVICGIFDDTIFYFLPFSMQDKRKLWIATTFKRRFCTQFMPKEDGKRYFCRLINFVQFYCYLHTMFSCCICLKKTLLSAFVMLFWFVLSFLVFTSYWVSKSEIFSGFSLFLLFVVF